MNFISRRQVELERWVPSIGIPLNREHFRERPPGTHHAVFEPGKEYGVVHYDRHNPHASLGDFVNHLWDWSPIGTLAVGFLGYQILKSIINDK